LYRDRAEYFDAKLPLVGGTYFVVQDLFLVIHYFDLRRKTTTNVKRTWSRGRALQSLPVGTAFAISEAFGFLGFVPPSRQTRRICSPATTPRVSMRRQRTALASVSTNSDLKISIILTQT
jgi:hypothetical protein